MRRAGIGVFDSATCFRSVAKAAAGDEALLSGGRRGRPPPSARRLGVLLIAHGAAVLLPQLFQHIELVAVAGGTDAEAGLADAVEVIAGGGLLQGGQRGLDLRRQDLQDDAVLAADAGTGEQLGVGPAEIAFPPRQVAAPLLVGGTEAGLRFLLRELADVEQLVFRHHDGQLDAEEVELPSVFFLGGAAVEVEFPVPPEVSGVAGALIAPGGRGEMAASHAGSSSRPAFAAAAASTAASA